MPFHLSRPRRLALLVLAGALASCGEAMPSGSETPATGTNSQGRTADVDLQAGPAIGAARGATATYRIDMAVDGTCQLMHTSYMDSLTSPYITGLSADLFQDSLACGGCFLLEAQGRQAIVVAGDLCPECPSQHFDLAQAASAALSADGQPRNFDVGDGLVYTPVACDWQGHALEYYFDVGSSEWNWYLQIFWPRYPIERVTAVVESTGAQLELVHDPWGRFTIGSHPGTGRIDLTLYGVGTSEVLTDSITWDGSEQTLVQGTGTNFQ